MFEGRRRRNRVQDHATRGESSSTQISVDENLVPYLSILDPSEVEELGRLPREAIVGTFASQPPVGRKGGVPPLIINARFVEFLHALIARWGPSEPEMLLAAEQQRDGWVYLIDGRTPTPHGTVPPEDIFGAFEVRSGKVVANSYIASERYTPFSERGLLQLSPYLRDRFLEELRALPTD